MSLLFVFGTRPEAIKLFPLIHQFRDSQSDLQPLVCVTAQHRDLLDPVLQQFEIVPDFDLNVMSPAQTLAQSTARILERLDGVLEEARPRMIVVQGDTTSTFTGALAGFYRGIPIAHVEAGLRTGDLRQPFPEELNRVFTSGLASLHFAPTRRAANNLLAEGVDEARITITGNTGVDALLRTCRGLEQGRWQGYEGPLPKDGRQLIVVTTHRRESFGSGMQSVYRSLRHLAEAGTHEIVFPVHPNPNVSGPAHQALGGHPCIHLIPPLDYIPFVDLLRRASIILTDSGGIQEEAPSLGIPVLVLREKTERQEAVEAGTAILVGTDENRILREAAKIMNSAKAGVRPKSSVTNHENPFGDGQASPRIASIIETFLKT